MTMMSRRKTSRPRVITRPYSQDSTHGDAKAASDCCKIMPLSAGHEQKQRAENVTISYRGCKKRMEDEIFSIRIQVARFYS